MEKSRPRKDREDVFCGYCYKKVQKDNLQYHTNSQHPGKPLRLRGDPMGIKDFLGRKKDDFASAETKVRIGACILPLHLYSFIREKT
jgi:hypothetical protein